MLWLDKFCGESNMFKRVKINGILFKRRLLRQFKMVMKENTSIII